MSGFCSTFSCCTPIDEAIGTRLVCSRCWEITTVTEKPRRGGRTPRMVFKKGRWVEERFKNGRWVTDEGELTQPV